MFVCNSYIYFFYLADADALLKERGLIPGSTAAAAELSIDEQMRRVQTIDNINSSSFVQQDFKSTRVWGKSKYEVIIMYIHW